MASSELTGFGRVVIQQCQKASLPVKPCEVAEIKRGMIVFVCFYKNATENCIDKIVNTLFAIKLCENDQGKLVSVLDLPGDLLIVPQASIGARLKGKSFQYHNNISKDIGLDLYNSFVQNCTDLANKSDKGVNVKSGTYGQRQVLSVETNGPNTHIIDF